jgi:hypothetical protein
MYYILAFILGAIVMDFAWAWKLGIVQHLYRKLTGKTQPNPFLVDTEGNYNGN